ncbi:MAG TPA: class I SAM-dependent methyltransferase [bacterium]|nr:class I SAM-dependent methyltransferase [bacterium]
MPEPKGASLYDGPFASFYDRHFGNHARELAPRLLRFWADPSNQPPLKEILDLGCGPGHLALPLLEAGYRVTGLDLSEEMLALAKVRCARYLPTGQAQFLAMDMTRSLPGRHFGTAVSSYNSVNHLKDPGQLRECFRSVKNSLHPLGAFLFDFHTLQGLRAWARPEKGSVAGEELEVSGGFEEGEGQAWMRLRGRQDGESFEGTIWNRSYPLAQVVQWLQAEGFRKVTLSGFGTIGEPLPDPGSVDRVLFVARP